MDNSLKFISISLAVLFVVIIGFGSPLVENTIVGDAIRNQFESNRIALNWHQCTEGYKCISKNTLVYQSENCRHTKTTYCRYGCEMGVCKTAPNFIPPYDCADTDDGADKFYMKGTVTGSIPSIVTTLTDLCENPDTKESCEGSVDCPLLEFSCTRTWNKYTGYIVKERYTCPYGCKEGACLAGCPIEYVKAVCPDGMIENPTYDENGCHITGECIQMPACTDSDLGQDHYLMGINSGYFIGEDTTFDRSSAVFQQFNDSCSGINLNTLKEFYCTNDGYLTFNSFTCPGRCVNGACIEPVLETTN